MDMKDKELLLKDLCGRLPYGVKCYNANTETNCLLEDVEDVSSGYPTFDYGFGDLESIKPYLRPMSSMTEEECLELSKLKPIYDEVAAWKYIKTPVPLAIANIKQFDFFHSHHLDWRDLIPKGLALEAPEGMYKMEE